MVRSIERREWDSNPRSLRSTVFKTVPFVRSGIPPEQRQPRRRAGSERWDHAELVAGGIGEHDPVGRGVVVLADVDIDGTEFAEPLRL